MCNAVKGALITGAVALGVATSAHAQLHSAAIHHYRYRQPIQRNFGAALYPRQLYNYSPTYNYDPGYPASDTAAALDE
jgi:hypothetical protein